MAKVIVVGGGAAGMVAAWRAAARGHAVDLLEANGKPGVKLRISGGGKCNITHAGSVKELLAAFRPEQARFLRPALHRFTNAEVLSLLEGEGVATYVRDNGRVFPLDQPGSAVQVVTAFAKLVREAGARLCCGVRTTGLVMAGTKALGVRAGEDIAEADAVILATGGASYPETGTRGEVTGWLEELGVPTLPWFPALAPIPLQPPKPEWEGVALRDGTLVLTSGPGGRRLAAFIGDIVFTRAGISGPAALELSRETEAARRAGAGCLAYAFASGTEVDAALAEARARHPHLAARKWLGRYLPERLCEPSLDAAGIALDRRFKDLTRAESRTLRELVVAFPLGRPQTVPLSRGEVAAGGVALAAVDPHTMRLRGFENLFVCGELLDVDGPVGGYNLQAAFSTGFVAGDSV
jgi:hypothetical protein